MEEYYQKVIQLQEKLRRSEEDRLKLEMKYNEMIEDIKKEEEAHLKKIRYKYKELLEEDRRRQQRNDKILDALDRIENRSMMWEAKIKKFKAFRDKYQHLKLNYPIDDHGDADNTSTKYDISTTSNELSHPVNHTYDYLESKYSKKYDGAAVKPEDKYSNLGNINSIYSKTTQQKEKDTCYDTNSKTSKDFENSLKQTLQPASSSSQNDWGASNKYLYDKSPEEVHNELKRLLHEEEKYSQPKTSESMLFDKAEPKPEPRFHSTDLKTEEKPYYGASIDYKFKTLDMKYSQPKTSESMLFDNAEPKPESRFHSTDLKTDDKPYYGAANDYKPKTLEMQAKIVAPEENRPVEESISNSKPEIEQIQTQFDHTTSLDVAQAIPQDVLVTNRELPTDKVECQSRDNKPYNFEERKVDLVMGGLSQITDVKNVFKEKEVDRLIQNEKTLEEKPKIEDPVLPTNDNASYEQQHDENNEFVKQVSGESIEHPIQQYDENNRPQDNVQSHQMYDDNQPISQYNENEQYLEQYDASGLKYDENVQPLQQYNENGELLQQYDENGQPLQQYDENGQSLQQYDQSLHQYDENGQFIQQYDENGQPLQQYDENGQPLQQYDEHGQPIFDASGQQYYADNSADGQYYDQSGGYPQYDENGQLLQQYDENGQPLQQYYGNEMVQYDENGQPILQYDENAQYDENGQLIQAVGYDLPQQEVVEDENKANSPESHPAPTELNVEIEEGAPTNVVPQPKEPKDNTENA